MKARRGERGQALVETALGGLVFVTVVLFGIHFAEVGFLSLKVEEAANSALFDSTAAKMHDTFSQNFSLSSGVIGAAGSVATQRYADWDGRASQIGGPSNVTQALTRGTPLDVSCQLAQTGLPWLSPRATGAAAFNPAYPGGPIGASGMLCHAGTQLSPFRIPTSFLENEPFRAQHVTRLSIPICSGRRAVNGSCAGDYGILLDDWGFSGANEGQECALAPNGGGGCANQGFYDMVRDVFVANGAGQGGAGSALAAHVTQGGGSPINENHFYMSFRGHESNYQQRLPSSHQTVVWKTSPFQVRPGIYNARADRCWLGRKC